jgi:hypothetical protein
MIVQRLAGRVYLLIRVGPNGSALAAPARRASAPISMLATKERRSPLQHLDK